SWKTLRMDGSAKSPARGAAETPSAKVSTTTMRPGAESCTKQSRAWKACKAFVSRSTPTASARTRPSATACSAPGSWTRISEPDSATDERCKLPPLVHLAHDVAAADELSVDVDLGDGRPVGVGLDALADLRIGEDVHGGHLRDAGGAQRLHRPGGEAAHGEVGGPFHEDDHPVGGDGLLDPLLEFFVHPSAPVCAFHWLGVKVRNASACSAPLSSKDRRGA